MNPVLDAAQIRQHIDFLLAAYPELGEDDVLRADMIEGETMAFEFMSKMVRRIGESKALADGIELYVKDLRERAARIERRVDGIRALIFKVMEVANLKKAELSEATLSIRAGQPRVILTDETLLTDNYVRIKREPDKTKIKEMLLRGADVAGACLSNSEPSLSIRVK